MASGPAAEDSKVGEGRRERIRLASTTSVNMRSPTIMSSESCGGRKSDSLSLVPSCTPVVVVSKGDEGEKRAGELCLVSLKEAK